MKIYCDGRIILSATVKGVKCMDEYDFTDIINTRINELVENSEDNIVIENIDVSILSNDDDILDGRIVMTAVIRDVKAFDENDFIEIVNTTMHEMIDQIEYETFIENIDVTCLNESNGSEEEDANYDDNFDDGDEY